MPPEFSVDDAYDWMSHIAEKLEEAYPNAEIQVTEGLLSVLKVEPLDMHQEVWYRKEQLWDEYYATC